MPPPRSMRKHWILGSSSSFFSCGKGLGTRLVNSTHTLGHNNCKYLTSRLDIQPKVCILSKGVPLMHDVHIMCPLLIGLATSSVTTVEGVLRSYVPVVKCMMSLEYKDTQIFS